MLAFLSNGIVSHLLVAGVAVGATWAAMHRTQIKSIEAAVKGAAATVAADVKK